MSKQQEPTYEELVKMYSDSADKFNIFGKGKSKMVATTIGGNSEESLIGMVLETLKKSRDVSAVQVALQEDPHRQTFAHVYKHKSSLIPNDVLKRIRDTEELVGGIIIPTRARQMSLFARPRANQFDIGVELNLKPHAESDYTAEQKEQIRKEVYPVLRETLLNCGSNEGYNDTEKRTLSQLVYEIIEDAMTYGAWSLEARKDGDGKFHSIRATDTGTIYFVNKKSKKDDAEKVREASEKLLKDLGQENFDIKKFEEDEYTYVQVIAGEPKQVFTDKELLYWSLSPSTDIYRSGYPVSPLERILSAITTHINLTTHNKLYFVNGRAARNVLVFKSENLEEEDINGIRTQMAAHINSANSSHRMPVFGVGAQDSVEVLPLDGGAKDMEFQYLADLNARYIFAAYQMSPDEVAALSYLSRGTNSQAMSEGNNEWKLVASRDTGLRPLLLSLEDFFNERVLPLINPEWAKIISINFAGLDAESPEKLSSRLTQDAALFLSMNDIMSKVEKDAVPIGGRFPLSQPYLQVIEKYYTKGQILKAFGGKEFENSDKDPDLQFYMNDPVWLQMFQMKQQQEMMQQQMQAQAGAQQPVQDPSAQQPPQDGQSQEQEDLSEGQDLDSILSQLSQTLTKSEQSTNASRKELIKKFKSAQKKIVNDYEKMAKESMKDIMDSLQKAEHTCDDDCKHDK